jgi:DNA-binding response OmpR family regulator
MSDSHRILVVDDDFATLDFLRSILELSEGNFEVLGVPSAEEGMLAFSRMNFSLLVTDVRLPGMDGLEMAQKAREIRAGLPIIMITGYESPNAEAEAAALGVVNYFIKPLDAEDFLNAVFEAVEGIPSLGIEQAAGQRRHDVRLVPPKVTRRLEALRADTGAQRVVLATVSGEILFCSGGMKDDELQQLVTAVAFSMDSSFHLSDQLGASEPQTIQFLVGERADLYCANVTREHFVAILFDAQVRRGRIGTVWVFTRRAINDLRSMLVEDKQAEAQNQPGLAPVSTPAKATVEGDQGETGRPIAEPLIETGLDQSSVRSEAPVETEPDETPVEAPVPEDEPPPANEETEQVPENIDTDAFWDEVLGKDDSRPTSKGISFEEAQKRGIIAPDFKPEED